MRWANRVYEPALDELRGARRGRRGVRPRRAERDRDRLLPRCSSRSRSGSPGGRRGGRARPTSSSPPAATSPAFQNGLALAGDYMSAASFLGIAGLVALTGFDGLIYSIGFLVGWPIVLVPDRRAAAEPRPLHVRRRRRVPAAPDARAHRRRGRHARRSSIFYLIAQMVGAGNLIHLIFGLPYDASVADRRRRDAGATSLFGGMIATTWVQIVKAVLLLGGATVLALLVLAEVRHEPARPVRRRRRRSTAPSVLAPGKLVSEPWDAISLGLALMFGTAGLPHILMRFYTVPDARAARASVSYATIFIGFFYLITFVLGFGAMALVGRTPIKAVDKGGNMAAPLLARERRRHAVPRLHLRGRVRDDPRGRRRAHALGRGGALARSLGERRPARRGARARAAPRRARSRRSCWARSRSCSASCSRARTSRSWSGSRSRSRRARTSRRCCCRSSGAATRPRARWRASLAGAVSALVLISLSPTIRSTCSGTTTAIFPLKNPALISMPLAFGLGIVVSLLRPSARRAARFVEAERQIVLGTSALPTVRSGASPARAR